MSRWDSISNRAVCNEGTARTSMCKLVSEDGMNTALLLTKRVPNARKYYFEILLRFLFIAASLLRYQKGSNKNTTYHLFNVIPFGFS